MNNFQFLFSLCCCQLMLISCGKNDDASTVNIQETAQQVGDTMASIDEVGGSSGSIAFSTDLEYKTIARVVNSSTSSDYLANLIDVIFPSSAYAAACYATDTWGTCTNNVVTRTFSNCTIRTSTLSGSVTLTYNDGTVDSTCSFPVNGTLDRNPSFTMTGIRGGTLTVSKTGTNGQRLTKTATGVYSFENDGIRRVIAANGATLYDYTTTTVSGSPLTITGSARASRVVDGGTLRVTNNLTSVYCDYSPEDVTWSSGCNCPSSGTWTGTCSDSKTTELEITGCGTGTLTINGVEESLTFDRCLGI